MRNARIIEKKKKTEKKSLRLLKKSKMKTNSHLKKKIATINIKKKFKKMIFQNN